MNAIEKYFSCVCLLVVVVVLFFSFFQSVYFLYSKGPMG